MTKLKPHPCKAKWFVFIIIINVLTLFAMLIFPANITIESKKIKPITFQKVLQITDEDESYYFRYPTKIYQDEKENLYILDGIRILKFSREGKFKINLVTKGQGPGEVTRISNFQVIDQGKKIIIHNSRPNRIIRKDASGKLLKEFPIEKEIFMNFIHYDSNTYYFFQQGIPEIKQGAGIREVDHYLCTVTPDGKTIKKIHTFPVKKYIAVNGASWGTQDLGDVHYTIWDERYLFVSHTPEYNIKCFDLLKKKIINEIKVSYERKKIPEELRDRFKFGRLIMNGKTFQAPTLEYFNDIQKLLIHGNHLWVVTSTVDEEGANRIDVYNFKGENIGCFYASLPGKTERYTFDCFIHGQHLYASETNDEGDVSIVKYKIIQ